MSTTLSNSAGTFEGSALIFKLVLRGNTWCLVVSNIVQGDLSVRGGKAFSLSNAYMICLNRDLQICIFWKRNTKAQERSFCWGLHLKAVTMFLYVFPDLISL